jgi:hypothetical protein
MSLSIIRTPNIRLSLANMDVSPRGTVFMLSIPDAEPELEVVSTGQLVLKTTILTILNALVIEAF